MNNPIGIIGAMDVEVTTLSQKLCNAQDHPTPFINLPILTGSLGMQKVVIACCGIGKVNAALATQYIIDHFNPKAIINTGVAGGVSPQVSIGDLVIGQNSLQHDFDVRNFGYPKGTIPSLKTSIFPADPKLIELAVQAARTQVDHNKIHQGLIVSGDQFISSLEQKREIISFFPKTMCAEMEGAAIAQVAHLNQIPHLIVRAISDQADNTAPEDFDQYLLEIIPTLNAVIQKLVSLI